MYFPKTEREARALSRRKLKSIRNQAKTKLYAIATYWDEGQVTNQIDIFLQCIDEQIDWINECIDEEIDRHENEDE